MTEQLLTTTLHTTRDLRLLLLASLGDLVLGKITPNEARARAALAREVVDTIRIEIIAARSGLENYKPITMIEAAPVKEEK